MTSVVNLPTITLTASSWTTTVDSQTGTVDIRFDNGPAPMVVGADVPAKDFSRLGLGGPLAGARVTRVFCGPGEQILPWTHPKRQVPAGVAEHLSWKDWPDDQTVIGWITTLLNTMPARLLEGAPLLPELHPWREPWQQPDTTHAGFSLLLTWCHEGEPDCIAAGIKPTEWRRRHRLVYDTIRAHSRGGRVGYMSIQTGTWTEAHSDPAAGKVKGDYDPITWWSGTGDYAGYDAYVLSQDKHPVSLHDYPDPATFFTTARALAAGAGRPLYLPELGVVKQGMTGAQDDGSVRAQWLMQVVPYLRAIGCAAVSWWDATGANGRDFRLDPISLKAWKDAIAGRL